MRLDFDSFREIGDALVRNKSRSLLTGFGIFWGLFMLLFLLGGGKGLKKMLGKNFDGFATNTVVMFSSNTSKASHGFKEGRYWDMDDSDMKTLRNMIPEFDVITPMMSQWSQPAIYDANTVNVNIKGVLADYQKIESPQLKYGRYLNETDCKLERKVCVIGKRIYNSLFPEGGDPCGKYIRIGSIYFQVVGVDVSSGNMSLNGNADETGLIPFTVARKLYHRGKYIDAICVTGHEGVTMSTLEERTRQVMAHKHLFDPTDKDALIIINTEQIFKLMYNLFKGVDFLILLVGIGTILAGAIGVSNIMMVTVKERTTEIGIRRAIGATPWQILSQIISESVALTLAAGSFGIVFSVLLLQGLENVVSKGESGPVAFQIGFWTAIIAALLLAVMGVAAGLAPAMRAMQIKAVDAMREE